MEGKPKISTKLVFQCRIDPVWALEVKWQKSNKMPATIEYFLYAWHAKSFTYNYQDKQNKLPIFTKSKKSTRWSYEYKVNIIASQLELGEHQFPFSLFR